MLLAEAKRRAEGLCAMKGDLVYELRLISGLMYLVAHHHHIRA